MLLSQLHDMIKHNYEHGLYSQGYTSKSNDSNPSKIKDLKKYIIKEIPIDYRDRPEGSSSKLNTVSDGIKVVKTIARMFKDYRPFRFFGIIALIFFILGLLVGVPVLVEFFKTAYITKVPSAILATGFMSLAAVSLQCGIILDTITRQHREDYELNLLRYEQIEKNNNKK